MPNPGRIFQAFNAYQQTAALKAAIELDVFTTIGDRQTTAEQIAQRAGAAERGIRILCDFLTVMGFLTKNDSHYGLAPDTAMFLDRRSPAYMGDAANFLDAPEMLNAFDYLTGALGRSAYSGCTLPRTRGARRQLTEACASAAPACPSRGTD